MKAKVLLAYAVFLFIVPATRAQKSYSGTVTEFIFSFSDVEFTEAFYAEYPHAGVTKTNLRFTAFFHISQDWHLDFTNNIGIITGFGLRNVGLISDEVLPDPQNDTLMSNYKIIRRLYTLGVPLSLKLGSFKDHLFFYAGGELELALHFKEKYWSNSHDRSGDKIVYTSWFGEQTPLFLPSVFAGMQLPRGFNIKAKYYLNDFLNQNYRRTRDDDTFNLSDLARYKKTQVFYLSLSWQFDNAYLTNKNWDPKKEVVAFRKKKF